MHKIARKNEFTLPRVPGVTDSAGEKVDGETRVLAVKNLS